MSEAESHVANAGLEFAKSTKDNDTPASASQVLYYRQVPPCLVLCSAGAQTMDFTCANEAASLSSEPLSLVPRAIIIHPQDRGFEIF